MGEELLHQVTLCLTPGIGGVTVRQLISYCGSAKAVFEMSFGKLSRVPGIGPKTARLILNGNLFGEAEKEINRASRQKIDLVFYTDAGYPRRLKGLKDAPSLLYSKGNIPWQDSPTLGIIGTRRMSAYGEEIINALIRSWKAYSPVIISGLAYGVDITAHRAALRAEVPTVAVLGHSLDTIYPPSHRSTALRMQKQGGLVSELRFGTKADAFQFPKRNRIIAGLSDALVVIEAQKSGGALITAKQAAQYGRPVFAVPGPINSATSKGCFKLIKDREAVMLTEADELASLLKWHPKKKIPAAALPKLSDDEQGIISILKNRSGVHIDEISWKTQLPINRTGCLLLKLEFEGLVRCLPGKKFSLVRK